MSAIVGHFSSGMVDLLGELVNGFTSIDDEGSSEMGRMLETQLRRLSSAPRKTARTPPTARSHEGKYLGKQNAEVSDSDHEIQDGGGDDYPNDDPDFRVVFRRPSGGFEAYGSGGMNAQDPLGSGVANTDVPASGVATEDVPVRSAGNDESTPPVTGTGQSLESQIMLTECFGTVSGDGVHSQPERTDTQDEVTIDASVKRCGSSLVHKLDKKYSRHRKK